jgi:hypothetical protein
VIQLERHDLLAQAGAEVLVDVVEVLVEAGEEGVAVRDRRRRDAGEDLAVDAVGLSSVLSR